MRRQPVGHGGLVRILQIAPPYFTVPPAGYGGIEWVAALLADGLVDAGHDVTLLASGGSRTKAKLRTVFAEPPTERIGDAWADAYHALAGYLHADEFDLIHDHTGPIGPALGALVDRPVVHTLHGPWVPEMAEPLQVLAPLLHLVAISQDQARRAPPGVEIAGVVPNGIPLEPFNCRTQPRGDGYLLFVGRANPEKGPEIAVDVARRLGRPLKMLVKINEPAEEQYWDQKVAPLLHGADVEVIPTLDTAAKAQLYADADATLFPIQWPEPFGLVMIESMACGTPVVAFDDGAAPEIVVDGETGFLIAKHDVDAFCEAVRRVSEIDPLACRRRVEEAFSGEAMVAGYDRLFRKLVS